MGAWQIKVNAGDRNAGETKRPPRGGLTPKKSGRSCTSACEEPQRLLREFPMILEDAAVPRIRENAELCIRQRLEKRDRIDGRHHDVIVAVGDENGMADRAQLFWSVAFAPLN